VRRALEHFDRATRQQLGKARHRTGLLAVVVGAESEQGGDVAQGGQPALEVAEQVCLGANARGGYFCDEIFLSGTGAQVTPVRSVDRRQVGDGGVGPITAKIGAYFADVVRGRAARRQSWLTPVWG